VEGGGIGEVLRCLAWRLGLAVPFPSLWSEVECVGAYSEPGGRGEAAAADAEETPGPLLGSGNSC